jgi:hypothetical protein
MITLLCFSQKLPESPRLRSSGELRRVVSEEKYGRALRLVLLCEVSFRYEARVRRSLGEDGSQAGEEGAGFNQKTISVKI